MNASAAEPAARPDPAPAPGSVAVSPFRWLWFAIAVAVGAFATWNGWVDLVHTAATHYDSDASILAPPVAAWLFWQRRAALRRPARGRWLGIVLAGISVGAVWWGEETDTLVAAQLGALLSPAAAFVAVFGAPAFRGTLAAWGALIFTIPIPGVLRRLVAQPLQEYGAWLAERSLSAAGFAIERLGASLVVDGIPVAVSEACDGMRMVSALVLVIYAVSFGREARPGIRVVMLLSAPILALACNTLRLIPTVLCFAILDREDAEFAHDALGWATLPICLVLIELLRMTLERVFPVPDESPATEASVERRPAGRPWPVVATVATFVAVAAAVPGEPADPRIDERYAEIRAAVLALPERIGPWRGRDVPVPLYEQQILKPNAMLSRRLMLLGGRSEANLLLIHCRDVRDMLGHWPASCYVSAGWKPEPDANRTIEVPHAELELRAMRHRFSRMRANEDIERTEVWSAFLAPGEPTTGSLEDLSGRAGARARSRQGIAQIQVCFPGFVDDAEADEAVRSVLSSLPEELVQLLKGDFSDRPGADTPRVD